MADDGLGSHVNDGLGATKNELISVCKVAHIGFG
jgi:hypothetical protein